ncbi:MAG: DNA gyrase subunit A [Nanoarchaeota archaeon]
MRYCVTGDTLLPTGAGLIPINALSDKKEAPINNTVLSRDGKRHKAVRFFNSGKHPIISLETEHGYALRGTSNHPLLCLEPNALGMPVFSWKLLGSIKPGDYAVINRTAGLFPMRNPSLRKFHPATIKSEKAIGLPSQMSADLAMLLGALVAEGSHHQKQILFNNKDPVFYGRVRNAILKLFPGTTLYERDIKGGCRELSIYHQRVVRFLANLGFKESRSEGKEIPPIILTSSRAIQRVFLQSLFTGDGSTTSNTDKRHGGKTLELCYHSKSKTLIKQLKIVLLNFGIVTGKPYNDKRHDCRKLQITGQANIAAFFRSIGFLDAAKQTKLSEIVHINPCRMSKTDLIPFLSSYLKERYPSQPYLKRHNVDRYNLLSLHARSLKRFLSQADKQLVDYFLRQNYFFSKVSSVGRAKNEETVYSVKVQSSCHSFVANGFINHNTEARLAKIAEELLVDLEKNTVTMQPNFDGTLQEPTVLPAKLPSLLVNGTSGIAVGMASSIPPHNLSEICDAIIKLIDNPGLSFEELITMIKGPDFPTGGIVRGSLAETYRTGRGNLTITSRTRVEDFKAGKRIIITEIPYLVNKAVLVEQIAEQIKEKVIQGISDLRDESDKSGTRIVIELKRDANDEVVLNQLLAHSKLRITFSVIMIALVNNEPKLLSLPQLLHHYIHYRQHVVRRRTAFDLAQAEKRDHILQGVLIALAHIDAVVALIKASKTVDDARERLAREYKLTIEQANAILDMRLQRLAALEQSKIREEHEQLLKTIAELKAILADEQRILAIIKKEVTDLKAAYPSERKTEVIPGEHEEIEVEDLIKPEDVVVTFTHSGYVKRLPVDTYKQQRRGGKGVIAAITKEEDLIEDVFVANTHSYLLLFTDRGMVHWLKVYRIPEASRSAMGKNIVNLVSLDEGERITAYVPVPSFDDAHFVLMCTRKGTIKKTNLSLFSNPRQGGIRAIILEEGDELIDTRLTDGKQKLIIATIDGNAVKFDENDVRAAGRAAKGVIGIRLKDTDEVIGMVIAKEEESLLTVTENGFGKRSLVSEYRLISRGGSGVINIQCTERNGKVVSVKVVTDLDEVMLISMQGSMIRMPCRDISIIGRNTQGVRLMKLDEGDKVVAAAKIAQNGIA